MTTTADRFHDALSGIFDEDPNRSQVLWGAFRATEVLIDRATDATTLAFLRFEQAEFVQDVIAEALEIPEGNPAAQP